MLLSFVGAGSSSPDELEAIKTEGLKKMECQYVHLSLDKETAYKVGKRRGKPIILTVFAEKMFVDGYEFFISENGVWLIDYVPVEYIDSIGL